MTDLCYLSAADALRLFRSGELSPVELAEAVIARAEAVEPAINAFAATHYEQALDQARAAEARYAGRGEPPRPLEGLLIAVKEEAPIAGQLNTLGSLPLRDVVAGQTAVFVQRILDAGGIVHARTTTPEFSCAPVTWTKLWGVTRNPWNTAFSPGGSSGGSGASLAAGSTTLATGSDIGGSIRIPASFCGVVGFKPPYGRVPEVEIFNLDHYCHEGPMARTVMDCALLENVIAGPHPSDVASIRPKLEIPADLGPARAPDRGQRRSWLLQRRRGGVGEHPRGSGPAARGWRDRRAGQPALGADDDRAGRADPLRHDLRPVDEGASSSSTPANSPRMPGTSWRSPLTSPKTIWWPGWNSRAGSTRHSGLCSRNMTRWCCPTFAVPGLPAEYDVGDPVSVNGEPCANWMDVMMTLPFNIASRCPVLSVPSGRSR